MKRTILLVGICCALTAPAATVNAAKSVTKAAEAPTQEAINNALTELLAERESWSGAAAPGSASPAGADVAGITAGATGDLPAFLALRTTWGQGPAAKAINAPLAKGASSSFPRSETVAAPGPSPQTIVQPEVARPLPKLALVSQADIVRARNALLSERDSWGKEPSLAAMPALSVIEAYFAERDSWGKGPAAEPVSAPLAKGATKKLTFANRFVVAEATRKTILHEFKPQPPVQLAQVDQSQINNAMQDLLGEREGWGTTPAVRSAQDGATATGGTGDMAALLAEREGWGTGPKPRTIKAPLAKGAEAKVRLSKTAPVGDSKPPIIQELEARPIPVVADIDMATINKAMQDLLAEREGWGTTPAAASAQGATATGGTGDMAALLAERESWGVKPSQSSTSTSTAAAAPAAGTTAASRRSCSDELSRLASERKIFFGSSSAKLQSKSNKMLEQIAETIKSCGDVIILIEGHTDSIGTTGANQALSEARAKAVLEYLAAAGVERSRLKAIGHGESKPIASNATSKDRALNRRIEFGTP